MTNTLRIALCALAAVSALTGCATKPKPLKPLSTIPSYLPEREGTAIRRVAILPLYCEQDSAGSLRAMDMAFNAELNKTSLFELVPIGRAQMESLTTRRQISSVEVLPGDLIQQLVARYGVDAVLFTDVTHYFPYQPISVGARSKLVDVRTGQIRWATDYLFDSGRPEVAEAARGYYLKSSQKNLPIPDDGTSILQSPARFSQFVAHETYRTLLSPPPAGPQKIVLNSPQNPPMTN